MSLLIDEVQISSGANKNNISCTATNLSLTNPLGNIQLNSTNEIVFTNGIDVGGGDLHNCSTIESNSTSLLLNAATGRKVVFKTNNVDRLSASATSIDFLTNIPRVSVSSYPLTFDSGIMIPIAYFSNLNSYTPTLVFTGTGTTTLTYNTDANATFGRYLRIGKFIWFFSRVTLASATFTNTGVLANISLPSRDVAGTPTIWTSASIAPTGGILYQPLSIGLMTNISSLMNATDFFSFIGTAEVTRAGLYYRASSTTLNVLQVTGAFFTNTTSVAVSGFYFTRD